MQTGTNFVAVRRRQNRFLNHEQYSMSLKNLPLDERPRERLARLGPESLSTSELLAILIGSGQKNKSVLVLAGELLSHFGSLRALVQAPLQDLQMIKGIGEAKAIQLKAAFALLQKMEAAPSPQILLTPSQIFRLIHPEMAHQKIEVLMVLLFDVKRALLHKEIIAKGTLTELLLHPREVFHLAIRHHAHSLVVAHNHPSGDPTPSKQDIEITQILKAAGRVVGIELSDHIIVGRESYFSFSQAMWK